MGASNRPKSQVEPKQAAQMQANPGASVAARHAHDRLVFLMANFVGCPAVVALKNGDRFTGIFSAATLDSSDSRVVLKMSQSLHPSEGHQTNGSTPSNDDYVGHGEDHVLIFEMKDIAGVDVKQALTDKIQAKLANGSSFRTDTDISGNQGTKERTLEAWQDTTSSNTEMSLNGASALGWDQFETNKKLFGVKSDYDETMYTTAINRSSASYKQRAAQADRLAREIESSETTNSHVAEERGQISPEADGMDEEARYSGVMRDVQSLKSANPNRYTPPARRAPTGQSTVPGAPVDSAIIASSLARPDSAKNPQTSKTPTPIASGKENENVVPAEKSEATTEPGSDTNVTNLDRALRDQQGEAVAQSELKTALKTATLGAGSSRASAAAKSGQRNVTPNVQKELLESFKQFSASEKIKAIDKQREYQEKVRANKEKERDDKINDLKMFSVNFKLNSPAPHDILGIMARDKEKQKEIERKTQQHVEERVAAQKASAALNESVPAPNINERPGTKGPRSSQGPLTQMAGKPDKSSNAHANGPASRIPGQLGQRLLAQQQYPGRGFPNVPHHMAVPDPRMQPSLPNTINTNVAAPRLSGLPTPSSAMSNFNVQAMEFRPNPAALTFQPGDHKSASTSPTRSRTKSNARQRPLNRVSFWSEGKKPERGLRKPLKEILNPFPRLRREAQAWIDEQGEEPKDMKVKEVESNGGIRHAYRTPPRWPVSSKLDKGWAQILGDALLVGQPVAPVPYAIAPQHQVPAHLQGYYGAPRTPNQNHYRGHGHHQGREYFDDHQRMQSGSTHSSVQPSPSMRHPMLANPQQLGYRMENGQTVFPMTGAQPTTPGRQYVGGQYVMPQGAPPMMISHSQQGQYMSMQQSGQMPMYAPMPGQMYSMPAPQQGIYSSPRAAPMMVNQGSQHAHMPQQLLYQQQAGQGYPPHTQQMPMRGGVPMMQQGSYGSGQHLPHQGPQFRPQFAGGNFPQQQMMTGQMMPQQPIDR